MSNDRNWASVQRTSKAKGSPWYPMPKAFREVVSQAANAVLLETALPDRNSEKSFLFIDPVETLVAWNRDDLNALLRAVDSRISEGYFVAGYFAYECGEEFAGPSKISSESPVLNRPLVWLGVYRPPIQFDHRSGSFDGSLPASPLQGDGAFSEPVLTVDGLQISKSSYESKIARIHEYLAAGDTYQVNFTDRFLGSLNAHPLTVYNSLLEKQPVPFAAYVNAPQGAILSFSPELFYRTAEDRITVRPMKGTWARGLNLELDLVAEEELRSDEKNRSEHVMIVDLLRNDIGKICEMGSVRVERFLDVERYATLLQMTSTVTGQLNRDLTPTEIFRNLFPSGSITGAPKRRTMEIIRELETGPRGVYTGAIGYFGPGGTSCFNVAIRTLSIAGEQFSMGVGGGITAGSQAEEEYRECEMKAAFLTKKEDRFRLIETMRCAGGIDLLHRHLMRLANSAEYFGIEYDADALREELGVVVRNAADRDARIRLLLSQDGTWRITASPLETTQWQGRILLAGERSQAHDVYLQHKTTHRIFYDQYLVRAQQDGFDEVLFLNEASQVTEGAISSVFFKIDGTWRTPALSCGVLPGVKRADLLESLGDVRETIVSLADLAQATEIWMCNAVRGGRVVKLIVDENGVTVWDTRDAETTHPVGGPQSLGV